MIIKDTILKYDEKVILPLRELYSKYGYSQYKMSKFEEYDLYVRNKDFLISDGVITFTDTNGRLMALKPDVTLSIIKNSKDIPGFVQKFYYNENVYRVSERTNAFKEIMQVGLECIGDIDEYSICEVVSLAARSLISIDKNAVLDISHLDILSEVFDFAEIPEDCRDKVMKLVGEKNAHELSAFLRSLGIVEDKIDILINLIGIYGKPCEVIPQLRELLEDRINISTVENFNNIIRSVDPAFKDYLRIDFSVISDIKYYNGIVFKGFISGIPQSVLSGGQYDRLMKKMQRKSGAVGFAVYLDMLERYLSQTKRYDADTVILYGDSSDYGLVKDTFARYSGEGSVTVQRNLPERFRYKRIVKISKGEVTVIEENA